MQFENFEKKLEELTTNGFYLISDPTEATAFGGRILLF